MKKILIWFIQLYRYCLSPFLGQHCRFYPSCSKYAQDALHQHGAMRGSWLAAKRLSRCHPWHDGGVDVVPENLSSDVKPEPTPELAHELSPNHQQNHHQNKQR